MHKLKNNAQILALIRKVTTENFASKDIKIMVSTLLLPFRMKSSILNHTH